MSDNGQIVWEDPPPNPREPGHWKRDLLPLTERPGQWARLRTTPGRAAQATATNLTRGKYALPPGRWEFISRATGDGGTALYARYLGPEDSTS